MDQLKDLPAATQYILAVMMASITTILASVMVLLLSSPWTYVLLPVLIAGVVATGVLIGLASKKDDRTDGRS